MTYGDDASIDLEGIEALARAAGLPVEEFLQAATVQASRAVRRRIGSSLYQRIRYAGGLRRLVEGLYPRVLADPLLVPYFKHLDDRDLQWLRWHLLTLLAVVAGGPSRYEGRDLQDAHGHLQITGEAFDRLVHHLRQTLQHLHIDLADQEAVIAAVQARRSQVVTFEEPKGEAR